MATRSVWQVTSVADLLDPSFDGVVVVTDKIANLKGPLECLQPAIKQHGKIDKAIESTVNCIFCSEIPSNRLIVAPTGPLNRDFDDVRRYQDAAVSGIKRAFATGCVRPVLVLPQDETYRYAGIVTALGALHALYVPLDVREFKAGHLSAVTLGLWSANQDAAALTSKIANALENGRYVYRDIGGSDPERMAPPQVAEYMEQAFKDTCIKMEIISDVAFLESQYPLLGAVNRSSKEVPRHNARLIRLEYNGEGPIDTTLMLVGKGITYDTGGADLKVGGAMEGMHRDKCGAAFVASFFKVLSEWKPKGLRVVGTMAVVRNNIGPNAYVTDEIIISRAGKRVRIGNTDAEGRMVMADCLCQMKEQAPKETNPQLFTIATLTGHVIRAYGENYTACCDNGPARKAGTSKMLFEIGEESGDPFEISTIRREDYLAHSAKTESEDVWQSNGKPSTLTSRGHQSPAAFLIMASGLDKHGMDSTEPLKYTHLDIAGSSGPYPGIPTGAPLVAMAHTYILNRASGI